MARDLKMEESEGKAAAPAPIVLDSSAGSIKRQDIPEAKDDGIAGLLATQLAQSLFPYIPHVVLDAADVADKLISEKPKANEVRVRETIAKQYENVAFINPKQAMVVGFKASKEQRKSGVAGDEQSIYKVYRDRALKLRPGR